MLSGNLAPYKNGISVFLTYKHTVYDCPPMSVKYPSFFSAYVDHKTSKRFINFKCPLVGLNVPETSVFFNSRLI